MKMVIALATASILALGSTAFAASGSSGASNNDTSMPANAQNGTATVGGSMKNPGGAAVGSPTDTSATPGTTATPQTYNSGSTGADVTSTGNSGKRQ
jgi:hypothetical protein